MVKKIYRSKSMPMYTCTQYYCGVIDHRILQWRSVVNDYACNFWFVSRLRHHAKSTVVRHFQGSYAILNINFQT